MGSKHGHLGLHRLTDLAIGSWRLVIFWASSQTRHLDRSPFVLVPDQLVSLLTISISSKLHEHVQKMFKSLEISKYSQQEFEHVHEQFMNKLDNPWTVHELRPSAGAVRSTFFCGVSRKFFFWFQQPCPQGYLEDFWGKKVNLSEIRSHDFRNEN